MNTTEGYVIIACGDIYKKLAQNFINSLRINGDNRPVAVIDEKVLESHPLFETCTGQNERYSILPKITMDMLAPFDHNIHIDVDALCLADTQYVWDLCKGQDQFILHRGWERGSHAATQFEMGIAESIEKATGIVIPRVQGAFQYYRKCEESREFYEWLRDDLWHNYQKLTGRDYILEVHHRNSRSDQIMFSMAYGKFGLNPVSIEDEPIMTRVMTFNDVKPPYYHVNHKYGDGPKLDRPVAFTHIEQLFQQSVPAHELQRRLAHYKNQQS